MASIGTYIIWLIMVCAVLGAIAAIRDPEKGLGKEFTEGLHSIGPIFIPVAGIMAAIPYLSHFIEFAAGPLFALVGADPSIAATTVIAGDMGGYQLADKIAQTREAWAIATVVGFMSGATIIFSIPVGLAMLKKADHKYMALGIMSGILSVPVGVLISCTVIALSGLDIRPEVSTASDANFALTLGFGEIFRNLLPLIIFCVAIALGLRFAPDAMITGFLWFGKIMYAGITLVLVASIVEYFTGFFTNVFGHWGFDPIIADEADQFRALEVAGYIGIMLAGAFPMVYLLTKYLAKPMEVLGAKIGVAPEGAAGLLAACANILAMFRLVEKMRPRDKVVAIAFAVCAAFTFGDHLAFTANFQPTLIAPLILGKLLGGVAGFILAVWLSVPKAEALAAAER
ncbi:ethanolamine utilization protein EutH [Pseudomonas sp. GX19020]|uniref:ethanolamine utilization protein EutH n=1 Tax=Pseudomonadota TaxID=1224 RepID=UPI00089697D9|nr:MULTISPECIES: ethanolamine utilization protein EutH [Pseudomonadota]MCL4067814.1 ethanolamine utilization protein EutH [Pseudomonas sp. GX19020]SEC43088.1 ethanolamine transporter [Rhodobacter sp. 24-YEA-8]